ncbi:MAG: threonine synthase [Campylobacterales bacterium]
MEFIETRGNNGIRPKRVSFSQAIMNPAASFGGLYVPRELPSLESGFLEAAMELSYKELAYEVVRGFDIDIDDEVLKEAVALYDGFDDKDDPLPIKKVGDNYFLELYHGPTRAFKDVALQPFGYLLSHLAKSLDKKLLILTATSGDTGPATLESFAKRENIQVVCIYPEGGTSDVQRLQMVTESAQNLKVVGIKGDFDDAQNALKNLLNSEEFIKTLSSHKISLSAANSVNFGRIIFQCVYHVYAYLQAKKGGFLNAKGEIDIVVPSGNFGNALGGFYAKEMGVPIGKISIVTNANDVLSEFIKTGSYDLRGKNLQKTLSPAMDILKSSNIERVLHYLFGSKRTRGFFDELLEGGFAMLSKGELEVLQSYFDAGSCDDVDTLECIKNSLKNGYVLDPHTATALDFADRSGKKGAIICSTAEWTKFAPTLAKTYGKNMGDKEALEFIKEKFGVDIKDSVSKLFAQEAVQKSVVDKAEIEKEILSFV